MIGAVGGRPPVRHKFAEVIPPDGAGASWVQREKRKLNAAASVSAPAVPPAAQPAKQTNAGIVYTRIIGSMATKDHVAEGDPVFVFKRPGKLSAVCDLEIANEELRAIVVNPVTLVNMAQTLANLPFAFDGIVSSTPSDLHQHDTHPLDETQELLVTVGGVARMVTNLYGVPNAGEYIYLGFVVVNSGSTPPYLQLVPMSHEHMVGKVTHPKIGALTDVVAAIRVGRVLDTKASPSEVTDAVAKRLKTSSGLAKPPHALSIALSSAVLLTNEIAALRGVGGSSDAQKTAANAIAQAARNMKKAQENKDNRAAARAATDVVENVSGAAPQLASIIEAARQAATLQVQVSEEERIVEEKAKAAETAEATQRQVDAQENNGNGRAAAQRTVETANSEATAADKAAREARAEVAAAESKQATLVLQSDKANNAVDVAIETQLTMLRDDKNVDPFVRGCAELLKVMQKEVFAVEQNALQLANANKGLDKDDEGLDEDDEGLDEDNGRGEVELFDGGMDPELKEIVYDRIENAISTLFGQTIKGSPLWTFLTETLGLPSSTNDTLSDAPSYMYTLTNIGYNFAVTSDNLFHINTSLDSYTLLLDTAKFMSTLLNKVVELDVLPNMKTEIASILTSWQEERAKLKRAIESIKESREKTIKRHTIARKRFKETLPKWRRDSFSDVMIDVQLLPPLPAKADEVQGSDSFVIELPAKADEAQGSNSNVIDVEVAEEEVLTPPDENQEVSKKAKKAKKPRTNDVEVSQAARIWLKHVEEKLVGPIRRRKLTNAEKAEFNAIQHQLSWLYQEEQDVKDADGEDSDGEDGEDDEDSPLTTRDVLNDVHDATKNLSPTKGLMQWILPKRKQIRKTKLSGAPLQAGHDFHLPVKTAVFAIMLHTIFSD